MFIYKVCSIGNMNFEKLKKRIRKCNRCGYEWLVRDANKDPVVCPACNTIYWNIPRKNKVANKK